jgi:hypothetical protein
MALIDHSIGFGIGAEPDMNWKVIHGELKDRKQFIRTASVIHWPLLRLKSLLYDQSALMATPCNRKQLLRGG